MPVFGEDRFGVKLHALDRQAGVAHAHDLVLSKLWNFPDP